MDNAIDLIDRLFCPGGDDERAERRRIMSARDCAPLRATSNRCDSARALYWMTVEAVQGWITSPASIEQLRQVRRVATRLFQAADEIERMEATNG